MNAWEQYFTECEAITDRNAELVEEKFKECEAYTEQVLKKTYREDDLRGTLYRPGGQVQ